MGIFLIIVCNNNGKFNKSYSTFFLGKVIDGVTTFSNLAIVNNLLFMATFFVFSMFFLYIKNKKTIEIVSKIEIDMKKKFSTLFLRCPTKIF